ncbi:uncharacterized protein EI90DRAFT_3045801 [Cantharellus anzutake]|uniref:uncharacterized protein n=1 Tax=Cantharellus anzutake TaxID=1750568 RepID=UPI0019070B17|nr:uncharacterized protein EI90DRAFT_3045801 [Cantharellus anzutake]KAF8336461.1 hypothetical protein EI90DRAFT_3045801 [Cantharellus anzutake]
MARSHTLKNAHRTSIASNALANEIGTLREDRTEVTQSEMMNAVEASLRTELFEKDREKDRLLDQILSLQVQLAQRPPLSTLQELENEKKTLDMILLGTQRENEKMMAELERNGLKKLYGENWQSSLNISSTDTSNTNATVYSRNPGLSTLGGNPNCSMSSLSLSSVPVPRRWQGKILPTSLTGIPHVDSDEEDGEREDSTDPEDEAVELEAEPTPREKALEQELKMMKRQHLTKVIQRAETESKGLDARLRELDVNADASS